MNDAFHSIPHSNHWIACEKLCLGWSSDEKYILHADDGRKLLLRISSPETYETKRQEYELVQNISALGINASHPVDFGRFDGGVYTIYTWIDGENMETALPYLSTYRQYELGLEAGRALQRIHTLPAPDGIVEWSERMNRKMDRKIRMAQECPLEIPGRVVMTDYIQSHRHLLKNRPQTMQHGDYHCGNMVFTPEGNVGIIDFNRFDVGDPWEEFNRIVWCAQCAPAFASGRINGYFNNDIPADFFPLVTMYILSNQLSSLPWAIPFGQGEIDVMLRQAKEVLSWYNLECSPVPRWYIPPEQAMLRLS